MLGACLLSAGLVFTAAHADVAFSTTSNFVAQCTPRDAGTLQGQLAANWIFDRVNGSCDRICRDRFTARAKTADAKTVIRCFTNLYVPFLHDPDAPWIVLLSHYDTKPGVNCPGANDGGSTTGLLIALADLLSQSGAALRTNVMLVWLDGEECVASYGANDGFWGSRRAAEMLKASGKQVRAVICLDMLGDRKLDIMIPANGSRELAALVRETAHHVGVTIRTNVRAQVKDDHDAFLNAGYPAVDLIDFDYGSIPGKNDWWHTPQDTVDKLSRESLLKVGRLVVAVLNRLDA